MIVDLSGQNDHSIVDLHFDSVRVEPRIEEEAHANRLFQLHVIGEVRFGVAEGPVARVVSSVPVAIARPVNPTVTAVIPLAVPPTRRGTALVVPRIEALRTSATLRLTIHLRSIAPASRRLGFASTRTPIATGFSTWPELPIPIVSVAGGPAAGAAFESSIVSAHHLLRRRCFARRVKLSGRGRRTRDAQEPFRWPRVAAPSAGRYNGVGVTTRTRIAVHEPALTPPPRAPLAAILAGGRSSRFGAPKAQALLRGRALVEWVRDAVSQVDPGPIVVGSEARLLESFGLRVIGDDVPHAGPLTGIIVALEAALEAGRTGALCVACDTPFIPPALIRELAAIWTGSPDRAVVAAGPAGIEPLCAIYPVSALPALRDRREAGLRSLREAVSALDPVLLDGDRLARFGDPTTLFLNVNTIDDLARADRLATLALG